MGFEPEGKASRPVPGPGMSNNNQRNNQKNNPVWKPALQKNLVLPRYHWHHGDVQLGLIGQKQPQKGTKNAKKRKKDKGKK